MYKSFYAGEMPSTHVIVIEFEIREADCHITCPVWLEKLYILYIYPELRMADYRFRSRKRAWPL